MPSLREALQPFSAVVLTGGSSGIGKSFIQLGGTLNPDLTFCNLSRRPPPENTGSNAAKSVYHFCCDLAQATEVERVAAEVREFLERSVPTGPLLLINNSGVGAFGAVGEVPLARELEMVDVNIRAVVHLTELLLPLLRQRGGAIMNIASTVAFQPTPYSATYGATKAFVLHWTLALNEELRGTNLRAMAVCPGTTRTDFFDRAGVSLASMRLKGMTADAVVTRALHALARRRSQVVPGLGNALYTFAGARLPKPVAASIAGRVLASRRPRVSGS